MVRVEPTPGNGVLESDSIPGLERLAASARRNGGRSVGSDQRGFDQPDAARVRGGRGGGHRHLPAAFPAVGDVLGAEEAARLVVLELDGRAAGDLNVV